MATNEFLLFAGDAAANVLSNAEYLSDAQREVGHQIGVARSALVNKAVRQPSIIASMIAQFICDLTEEDAEDDGTIETLLANFKSGIILSTGIVAGTSAWFYQNVAPIGWSIDETAVDAVLAVKGASGSTYATGGQQAGTWQQPISGSTTLTAAQSGLPAHNHAVNGTSTQDEMSGNGGFAGTGDQTPSNTQNNASAAASEGHTHPAPVNTWRPLAQVGIICTKD